MARNPASTIDGNAVAPDEPRVDTGEDEERESWGSYLRFLALVVLGVLAFRSFLFAPFTIPSESMLPRLMVGDYLVAAKWPYGYSDLSLPFGAKLIPGRVFAGLPERGEVVIFRHPVDGTDYIKRVIGLPGDTVAVREGRVVLNGRVLARSTPELLRVPVSPNTSCHGRAPVTDANGAKACLYPVAFETLPAGPTYPVIDLGRTAADDFGPVTVPEGRLFVMGDNRDNSQDSRFPAQARGGVGLVPADLLVGRASMILWSTDGSAEWAKPWTWLTAARWSRIGNLL
ncbi:signal peptidase I [Qipengyuania sp. MTN3-11]|uniref:signal peptidase I n=1 Tax=Qipengyuania sp. MTN3-11 TaxID=3056557 RepID=UPI0036F1E62A